MGASPGRGLLLLLLGFRGQQDGKRPRLPESGPQGQRSGAPSGSSGEGSPTPHNSEGAPHWLREAGGGLPQAAGGGVCGHRQGPGGHSSLQRGGSGGERGARRRPQMSRWVGGGAAGGARCCPGPGVGTRRCSWGDPAPPTPHPRALARVQTALPAVPPPAAGLRARLRASSKSLPQVDNPHPHPPATSPVPLPRGAQETTLNLGRKDEPECVDQGEGTRAKPRPAARALRWPRRGGCGEADGRVSEPPVRRPREALCQPSGPFWKEAQWAWRRGDAVRLAGRAPGREGTGASRSPESLGRQRDYG